MNVLNTLYVNRFGAAPQSVRRLPGSGSHRVYYRLKGPVEAIGVTGTDREENEAFITLSRHFRSKGISVPEIYAVSEDGMSYLQEDLGDTSLFDAVSRGRRTGEYSAEEKQLILKAVRALPRIQFEGAEGLDWGICYPQREFDSRGINFDLNYFKYDFLKIIGASFNEARLQDDFDRLKADLLKVPSETFLYRDFQGRNIMLRDGEPWFIDYQGGRKGPLYYDLASFVYQAKAQYPDELRRQLVEAYRSELARYRDIPEDVFRRDFRLFVLFRILQVLGAYGFRGLIEKKAHFIESIPYALKNLRGILPFEEYPYLSEVLAGISSPSGPKVTQEGVLTVEITSFSYRKGIPGDCSGNGGGFVFDCRALHNPGRYDEYKQLTGLDAPVISFLEKDGGILTFLDNAYSLVDTHVECFLARGFDHMSVSFGCTGGQHRSAYSAEHMASHIKTAYPEVRVILTHRELGITRIL